MNVKVELSPEHRPSHAVIYTDEITEEVQRVMGLLGGAGTPLTVMKEDQILVLRPEEIYMVRVEGGETVLYGEKERYTSRKRLYEWADQLGGQFMQISKATLVNLSYLDSVTAGFSGTLFLKLKNGSSDYVSRRYLPAFKSYLGL